MTKNWHQHSRVAPKPARTGKDGFVYDSKTEMERYYYLDILQKAGEISDLRRQVSYELRGVISGHHVIKVGKNRNKTAIYTPDFVYFDIATGQEVIEDCKGYRDEASKFRIRVFESLTGKRVQISMKKGKNWEIIK